MRFCIFKKKEVVYIIRVEKITDTIKRGAILHEEESLRQYDKSDKPRDQTTTQIGASGKVSMG